MTATTKTQKKCLITIFADFTKDHNATSIAKAIGTTRIGAFKSLKDLEKEGLVIGNQKGKSTFYRLNLHDNYTKKNIEVLLLEQAKNYQRWVDEFKALFDYIDIAIIFGSIVTNENSARDVDLLLVYNKKNNDKINSIIKDKNNMLTKKIHIVRQTKEDFIDNLNKEDKIIVSALREGKVIYGEDKLIEVMGDVTSRK